MVLHHQQPYRRRQVLGERRAERAPGVPDCAAGSGRERHTSLPGLPHSQAQEQNDLAQEQHQQQGTLGEDEGTDQQAADYCRKDDTHPEGSLRFELGELKGEGKRTGAGTH